MVLELHFDNGLGQSLILTKEAMVLTERSESSAAIPQGRICELVLDV